MYLLVKLLLSDQNQIITKFTSVVSDITLEPITSNAATSLNIDTYCGLASWSSATQTSIAGLTCDSITYKTQNAVYHNLIQINSNKTLQIFLTCSLTFISQSKSILFS